MPTIPNTTTPDPRAMAGDIPVFCSHDELVPVEKMVPNPRNPNQHPPDQIERLARVIRAQGWRCPITVSRRSGFIVRGEGRLMAAKINGAEVVPVEFQDYANEADEWADLIADNYIAELSDIDDAMLHELLAEIDPLAYEGTGYSSDEIIAMLEKLEATPSQNIDNTEVDLEEFEAGHFGLTCPRCGFLFTPKD